MTFRATHALLLSAALLVAMGGCRRGGTASEADANAGDHNAEVSGGINAEHQARMAALTADADRAAAIGVVHQNVAAMQKGNVEEVLATIHPESSAYAATGPVVLQIARQYQLSYRLESVSAEVKGPDSILVDFKQVTEKMSGAAPFRKNRVTGVHTLKRHGKEWKIWSTEIQDVQPL